MRQLFMDFWTYFTQVMEERRAQPRDDLASVFANARVGGEPLYVYRERRGRFEGRLGEGGVGSLIVRTDVGDARVRLSSEQAYRSRMH